MKILAVISIAILIEAVIQAIKPIWDPAAGKLTIPEIVSMAIGVVVAFFGKLDLLAGLVETSSVILLHIFYVLSGVVLGRGPSFVHDLWLRLRSGYGNELPPGGSH
jgi:hypothetical protein